MDRNSPNQSVKRVDVFQERVSWKWVISQENHSPASSKDKDKGKVLYLSSYSVHTIHHTTKLHGPLSYGGSAFTKMFSSSVPRPSGVGGLSRQAAHG